MSMGRFDEGDAILKRLLLDDPDNQLFLRLRASNLFSERRVEEILMLVNHLGELKSPTTDTRSWNYMYTGEAEPSVQTADARRDIAEADAFASERLLVLSTDLMLLRHAKRYTEIREILDSSPADLLRVQSFLGAIPGLGHRPVAELRGWNDLLMGDVDAAARSGRDVLAFVAAQQATPRNRWFLQMLAGTGHLFVGDRARAIDTVQAALQTPPRLTNVHMESLRNYMAALTLAWAAEHDEAVTLLERLSTAAPSVGPAPIARDPVLSTPLAQNARYEILASKLEGELLDNRRFSASLVDSVTAASAR